MHVIFSQLTPLLLLLDSYEYKEDEIFDSENSAYKNKYFDRRCAFLHKKIT